MSAICRLAGRRLLTNYVAKGNSNILAVRSVQMNVIPKNDREVPLDQHDEHNELLKRPMSPHLSIYELQLTSVLSVTHRATGMMLSGYFYLFALGPPLWTNYSAFLASVPLSPALQLLLKMAIALPFGFHLGNGVRHLIWDSGRCLTIKDVYYTGFVVCGLTAGITLFLSLL